MPGDKWEPLPDNSELAARIVSKLEDISKLADRAIVLIGLRRKFNVPEKSREIQVDTLGATYEYFKQIRKICRNIFLDRKGGLGSGLLEIEKRFETLKKLFWNESRANQRIYSDILRQIRNEIQILDQLTMETFRYARSSEGPGLSKKSKPKKKVGRK